MKRLLLFILTASLLSCASSSNCKKKKKCEQSLKSKKWRDHSFHINHNFPFRVNR